MFVYLGLTFFELLLYAIYNETKNEKIKNWLFVIGCLGIFLIVGLRSDRTGNDTIGYVRNFLAIDSIPWKNIFTEHPKDTGYYIFVKFIRTFTDSKVVFLLITALTSLIGIFDLIKQNSKSPILALFFYVTIGNFLFILTGVRQSIAMSICMIAVRFIQNKKLIPFLLLVLLAAQFHHSAYIFIVMYFLGQRKVTAISMIINTIVTVCAYFSYEHLLDIANEVLEYDYEVEQTENGFIFFAILICIITLALLTKSKWVTNLKETVILNSGIMCVIIWIFRLIGRTAERPSMYWLNAIPVVLPESIESLEHTQTQNLVRFSIIGLSLLFFAYRTIGLKYAFCF
ncbi:MAG: EpsG family protein [Ruminococcaceae bacterium]|nr:EpsG family protein [Oscillospiraceae bacterium]